jgi:hypothetical protein
MSKTQTIKDIVDKHLNDWIDIELNKLPNEVIEKEMADSTQNPKDEWKTWFPIDSKVTDQEIKEYEDRIEYTLPESYKTFLKHKHFYELNIAEASFFSHPVNSWKAKLEEMVFEGYPRKYLIDKGYVPFADYSDWGLLCFDTNVKNSENEYPIVLWDHEVTDKVELISNNFLELLVKLNKEESNKGN